MLYTCPYQSPLGGMTLVSDGTALCGVYFDGQRYLPSNLEALTQNNKLTIFDETAHYLDVYFTGKEPDFRPLISLKASNVTDFRILVWEILLTIPYGKTMTYNEIANIIAKQRGIKKMSAQAVGGAVGHNPLTIIVPCHRVVGTDGSLTGYAGGIAKKIELLKLEGLDTSLFTIPKKGSAL